MLHCLSEGQAAVGRTNVGDAARCVRPVRRAGDIKIPKEVHYTDAGLSATDTGLSQPIRTERRPPFPFSFDYLINAATDSFGVVSDEKPIAREEQVWHIH